MSATPRNLAIRQGTNAIFALCVCGLLLLAAAPGLHAHPLPGAVAQAPSAESATNLTGYWVIPVTRSDGSIHSTYFRIEQTGDAVTGTMLAGQRFLHTPLTGTFTNGHLHMATAVIPSPAARPQVAQQPPAPQMVVDGTFENGKLSLTTTVRGQATTSVAERTTKEATPPPPANPLPALVDVPDNGLVRTPPMGWNSWNKFAGRITDADVRAMADTMVSSGMAKAGYVYINIDDTWELGRDANGNITSNNKFPDMKALGDYIHSKGLKFGIYSSPGPLTCAGYMASYGHEAQDAKTFASWGVDYLKYDLCSDSAIYTSTRPNLQAIYQIMGVALQQTGRPIVYSMCEYGLGEPWIFGSKNGGNLWRTTGDIRDQWASMDKIGFSQIDISQYTRPGHWNDPDMLEIGNGGMSADEYRTHMSLWSMLAAPLIAGNDLTTMTEETKSILMNGEVIAVDQDTAAKPVQMVSHEGTTEVLMRPMADGSIVIGMFNRGPAAAPVSFAWKQAGMKEMEHANARDLWSHAAVKMSDDGYKAMVPAHGVALLRVQAGK